MWTGEVHVPSGSEIGPICLSSIDVVPRCKALLVGMFPLLVGMFPVFSSCSQDSCHKVGKVICITIRTFALHLHHLAIPTCIYYLTVYSSFALVFSRSLFGAVGDALADICSNFFPSFSQAQLVGGSLKASLYASGFAPACDKFKDALALQAPENYYLVFGLPAGPLNFMAGASVCFALRPNCGSNTGILTLQI